MKKTLTDKLYCMSEDEFITLASACSLQELYGFTLDEKKCGTFDETRFHQATFTLFKKEMLIPDEDGFHVAPEIKDVFACVKNAKYVLQLRSGEEGKRPACIYAGEDGVIYAWPATNGVDYVCIGRMQEESLQEFMEDIDLLPQEEFTEEIQKLRERSGEVTEVPTEAFEELQGKIFEGTLMDNRTHLELRRFAIIRNVSGETLVSDEADGERTAEPYTRKTFAQRICAGLEV